MESISRSLFDNCPYDIAQSKTGDLTTLCVNGFNNGHYRLIKTWEGIETGQTDPTAWYLLANSEPIARAGLIYNHCVSNSGGIITDTTNFGYNPGYFLNSTSFFNPTPDPCNQLKCNTIVISSGKAENICPPFCELCVDCCPYLGTGEPARCDLVVPCDIEWMPVDLNDGKPQHVLFATPDVYQRFFNAVYDQAQLGCVGGIFTCDSGVYFIPPDESGPFHYPVRVFSPHAWIQIFIKLRCLPVIDDPEDYDSAESAEGMEDYAGDFNLVIDEMGFRTFVIGGYSAHNHIYIVNGANTADFTFYVTGLPSGAAMANFLTFGYSNSIGFPGTACPQLTTNDTDPSFGTLYKRIDCLLTSSYVGTIEIIGE
jgi:hypothetical protein